jgi:hypothetical protein
MPTLLHRVRKREKANTKDAAIEKSRAIMVRKAPAKKKTAKRAGGLAVATNGSRVGSEDELDARLIREARRSDRSKVRYSVNELREQRGLAAI